MIKNFHFFLSNLLAWYEEEVLDLLDLGCDDYRIAFPDFFGSELLIVEVASVLITVAM
jgi:hypothetical protein